MISKDDINIPKIVLEYLKAIERSENKEFTIKQIVDNIKKYPSEEQPLIINELRNTLTALSLSSDYIFGYGHSPNFGSKQDSYPPVFFYHRFQCNEVRAQSNEEYIKYVKLLDDLTKR